MLQMIAGHTRRQNHTEYHTHYSLLSLTHTHTHYSNAEVFHPPMDFASLRASQPFPELLFRFQKACFVRRKALVEEQEFQMVHSHITRLIQSHCQSETLNSHTHTTEGSPTHFRESVLSNTSIQWTRFCDASTSSRTRRGISETFK